MQGYILAIHRCRAEDLLVSVLTSRRLKRLYRFYGARHSVINLGYKIDFSTEGAKNRDMERLRDVMHLGFVWLGDASKLLPWQQFTQLLHRHLNDVEELEDFYFKMLDDCAHIIDKTNAKRVLIEAYVRLLEFEGRLHRENECFLCARELDSTIALSRGFLPAHPECVGQHGYDSEKVRRLFDENRSAWLDDEEIQRVWATLQSGF